MKNEALFSSKDKSKILKCRLLQFLFSALRVEMTNFQFHFHCNLFYYVIEKLKQEQLRFTT